MGALYVLAFQIIGFVFRMVFKLVVFTGFWVSVLLAFLIDYVLMTWILGITMTRAMYPDIYPTYEIVMTVVVLIPAVIITGRNIYKWIKRSATGDSSRQDENAVVTMSLDDYNAMQAKIVSQSQVASANQAAKITETKELANALLSARRAEKD